MVSKSPKAKPLEHRGTLATRGTVLAKSAQCGLWGSELACLQIVGWPDERKWVEIIGLGFCKAPNSV